MTYCICTFSEAKTTVVTVGNDGLHVQLYVQRKKRLKKNVIAAVIHRFDTPENDRSFPKYEIAKNINTRVIINLSTFNYSLQQITIKCLQM